MTPTMELAPRPLRMGVGALEDPERLGALLAASGFFSDTRDAAQAVVKVLAGAELGFGPIASMTGVYIVKGRVTLSANLIGAAIKNHPAYDYRVRPPHNNDRCEVVYLEAGASCVVCNGAGHIEGQQGPCLECVGSGKFAIGSSEFTMADARTAGLAGGDNWKKYPRNMLYARAMSNGAKFYCPDVFAGAPIYTPDELGADIDPETGELLTYAPITREDTSAIARASAAPTSSAPVPRPEPQPDPEPDPEPQPDPEPVPAPAATSSEDEKPDDAQVSPDDAQAMVGKLHEWGTPQTMWRMALMTHGAESMDQLTYGQARELMRRARDRWAATLDKA